jgi:hypothetical protein
MRIDTQNTKILNYLKSGNTITSLEALNLFGCFRLASRISDLRKMGHAIKRQMVMRNGKRVALYSI